MPRTITIPEAQGMLRTRDDLLMDGHSDREIRTLVGSGRLVRVHRGWYVDGAEWDDLWSEGRHLVRVVAVDRNATGPAPIYFGVSAAVVLGFPLYRVVPESVHTVIQGARHGRTVSNVLHHGVDVAEDEIVEIDGIRCTSAERTALDLACELRPEAALAVADAALRRFAVKGQRQDQDLACSWRARLGARAAARSSPGARQARDLIAFADGRAQLPGESVSRLHLRSLGFVDVGLQARVVGPFGEDYWMDFAFRGAKAFGEFDGKAKYRDSELRAGKSVEDVLLDEKRREDVIRGLTGWRMARWESEHISTARVLGARLHAFGIHPPG